MARSKQYRFRREDHRHTLTDPLGFRGDVSRHGRAGHKIEHGLCIQQRGDNNLFGRRNFAYPFFIFT